MNQNDQNFLVQKIRTQYVEREHTSLDELKALDAKVRRPANVFAYVFGSIGAIVMGSGMRAPVKCTMNFELFDGKKMVVFRILKINNTNIAGGDFAVGKSDGYGNTVADEKIFFFIDLQ